MTEVTPQSVKTRLDAGEDFVLLDVREPHEREFCHIAGDHLFIPMNAIPERLAEIPQDKQVVVYCKLGGRSARVAAYLEANGYSDVQNLTGGVTAWAASVDPSMPTY